MTQNEMKIAPAQGPPNLMSNKDIKRTLLKGEVGSRLSLYLFDLDVSWTKKELMLFFTFNNHKPSSFEFAGPKGFPNAYIRYDSFALVIAALKYYHGMRYKGKLLNVRATELSVPLTDQIQLHKFFAFFWFLILFENPYIYILI